MSIFQNHEIISTYIVKQAYWFSDKGEIEIKGDNLIYSELGKTHNGVQCTNQENDEEIRKRCSQIADLFREIEELNK